MTTKEREQKAAKRFEAKAQPASGATPWAKEDMKSDHFLFQHKEVRKGTQSHSVKRKDFRELHRNAVDEGLEPAYVIDFEGEREWVCVPKEVFDMFVAEYYYGTD